jgi:hypothetical protein
VVDAILTNEEFVAESISGYKLVQGKLFYHVKWRDYPSSENTWEDAQRISQTAPSIVFDFENNIRLPGYLRTIPAGVCRQELADSNIGDCVHSTFKNLTGINLPLKLKPLFSELEPVVQRAGYQFRKAKTTKFQELYGKGFKKVVCLSYGHCFGIDLESSTVFDDGQRLPIHKCPNFSKAYFLEKIHK